VTYAPHPPKKKDLTICNKLKEAITQGILLYFAFWYSLSFVKKNFVCCEKVAGAL